MWKCPNCGTTNSTDVCGVCGRRMDFMSVPLNNSINEKKKSGILTVIIVLLVIMILAAAGVIVYAGYSKKLRMEFDRGLAHAEQLLNCHSYVECIEKLDELKTSPLYSKSPDALYLEGMAYMGVEDYPNSIACFENSLECASSDEVLANLAVCYAKNGNESKALRVLYKTNPGKDFIKCIESEVLMQKGKYEKAELGFRDVINMTGNNDLKRTAYLELARIYKMRRNVDGFYLNMQISVLEEAINVLNADSDITLTEMLAEAYFAAKQYDLSVIKFTQLLDIGYDKPHIYRNIAIIHQKNENLSEAEKVLFEMRNKYPKDSTCYTQLAFVYIDMESKKSQQYRNYAKAVRVYELALKYSTPDNRQSLVKLENTMAELRRKGWIN